MQRAGTQEQLRRPHAERSAAQVVDALELEPVTGLFDRGDLTLRPNTSAVSLGERQVVVIERVFSALRTPRAAGATGVASPLGAAEAVVARRFVVDGERRMKESVPAIERSRRLLEAPRLWQRGECSVFGDR